VFYSFAEILQASPETSVSVINQFGRDPSKRPQDCTVLPQTQIIQDICDSVWQFDEW
jgi:hypothetical protein